MGMGYRVVLGLVLILSVLSFAEEPVQFVDPEFKQAIEEKLGIVNPTPSDMQELTGLSISGNITSISGIEHAVNLEQISLHLIIRDLIPLTKIAGLKKIELSRYIDTFPIQLTDNELTILPDFSELNHLAELALAYTQIKDIHEISKLKSLTHLTLTNNCIDDLSPVFQLENLVYLKIEEENIKSVSLSEPHKLEEMEVVNASGDIQWIGNLTSLKKLTLRSCKIKDVSFLKALTQLTELNLVSNEIAKISPLQNLVALQQLHLDDNQISDLSPLAGLEKLTFLSVAGNRIQDVTPLTDMSQLEVLMIQGNPLSKKAQTTDLLAMQQRNPEMVIHCIVDNDNRFHDFVIPGIYILYVVVVFVVLRRLRKAKKKNAYCLVLGLFVLSLVPLPTRPKDIETAVRKSLTSLIQDERVIANHGYLVMYTPPFDSLFINHYRRLYYVNEIGVDNQVFEEYGLRPKPSDPNKIFVDGRDVVVEYTFRDEINERRNQVAEECLRFNYIFGGLGAHGFKLILYRNIFGVHLIYVHEWCS